MSVEGTIINITRFCTDDGPGIRTTVFLKGCPLRCLWCHNPESQDPRPECYADGETVGRTVTVEEALRELVRDRVFYETSGGGITVSGGEPLMQPDFVSALLSQCKKAGLHTALETCGFSSPRVFRQVTEHCDLVLFDIKETDPRRHREYTGVPPEPILRNLEALNRAKVPFVLRLPVVPGFNDRTDHFEKVRVLAEGLEFCRGIQIMPYHRLGEYKYQQLGRPYACAHTEAPSARQVDLWKGLLGSRAL